MERMVSVRGVKGLHAVATKEPGSTLKNPMHFIANSTSVASQTNSVSPVYMDSASQPASSNWQAMAAQPKLQKLLHAPPRNRKLTILLTWAIRLRPLLVCA